MNTHLLVIFAVIASLTACSSAPTRPVGAAEVRAKLTQLQGNPQLSGRAPVAMNEAETAVRAAEQPRKKKEAAEGQHLVQIANSRVDLASAQAQTLYMEDQRTGIKQDAEGARLAARTQEADAAHAQNQELEKQLADLNAKTTERGLVITLGDVLFTSGQAQLRSGATANLAKLSAFLNQYPNRTLSIEGHTDSQGSDDYNQALSQRRADAVRNFLLRDHIAPSRLTSIGMGESTPVADNTTATGRQLNRRVEVIIANPPAI